MFIKNQKGTQLINLDRVQFLKIRCNEVVAVFDVAKSVTGSNVASVENTIGIYKSGKIAQEVLDDIYKSAGNCEGMFTMPPTTFHSQTNRIKSLPSKSLPLVREGEMFTEAYDSNNIAIYEGDIIRDNSSGDKYFVVYDKVNSKWSKITSKISRISPLSKDELSNYTVIGNIYCL